jgi:hypothetical protein
VTLELSGVTLGLPDRPEQEILRGARKLTVAPGAALEASLPLRLRPRLPAGQYSGEIRFAFSGQTRFTPVVTPVSFQVNSLLGGLLAGLRLHPLYWVIPAAVLAALLILLLVLLLIRPGRVKSRFRLMVEGRRRGAGVKVLTIVEGKPLFLEEAEGTVQISARKTPASLARLAAVRGGVRLTVLRGEKFRGLKTLPPNILDTDLTVRLQDKKELKIRLASAK